MLYSIVNLCYGKNFSIIHRYVGTRDSVRSPLSPPPLVCNVPAVRVTQLFEKGTMNVLSPDVRRHT